jgi:hypothetical protein
VREQKERKIIVFLFSKQAIFLNNRLEMKGLNPVEATYLKLAWFFEEPEHENFNVGLIYQHLDND